MPNWQRGRWRVGLGDALIKVIQALAAKNALLWMFLYFALSSMGAFASDEVAHSSAEPKYYDSVRRFTTEDGLPQNSVNAIVQSQDGLTLRVALQATSVRKLATMQEKRVAVSG